MKKLMAVGVMMMCGCLFAAKGTREERIAALEEIVTWPPCCSNEDDYVPPEEDVRLRYELTRDEFLQEDVGIGPAGRVRATCDRP